MIDPVCPIPSKRSEGTPALHPLLRAAFDALEGAGVRWCLLRSPACLTRPTGDLDVLVARADSERTRRVLASLGMVSFPGSGSGVEFQYLTYDRATDCWLRLHFVTELSFGPRHTLQTGAEAACLARRRLQESVALLSATDAFWGLLMHCLVDKGNVSERHRSGLQTGIVAASEDSLLAPVLEGICSPQWSRDRLLDCVRRGDWSALEQAARALTATWQKKRSLATRFWDLLREVGRLPARLRQRLRRRGLSVAVLGPDGAGKSTLATGVQNSFCVPCRIIYMGFGVSGGQSRPTLLARLRVPGVGAPGRLFVLWGQFLKAQYHQACGRLVLFDRYTYDALAPPPMQRSWPKRFSSWVKAHACPAPDVVIVLDVPGEVMYARKREWSPEVLEAQRQRYLALPERLPQTRIVDATQPADAVRAEVIDHLWQVYADRWRR